MISSLPTCLELAVVRVGSQWCVITKQGRRRAFEYRIDAEEAALKLAAQARSQGQSAQVLVQDAYGELQGLAV